MGVPAHGVRKFGLRFITQNKLMQKFRKTFKIFKNQNGYILGMVMVFFVVFTILGLGFIKMSGFEKLAVSRQYHKTRAFYHADGGIHKGIWLLNNVSKAAATFSDATVSVTYDSVNLIMKATGSSGGRQDSLKVTLQASGGSSGETFTLRPTGTGATTQHYDTGCSSNWQCVDEETSDGDATHVYYSGILLWKTDTYALADPSASSGNINSVVVYIKAQQYSVLSRVRTVIRTASTDYYGTIIAPPATTYTDYSTTYTTNPNTSSAWTWSEVNSLQIGVRSYDHGDITQVWAVVYYTQ